MLELVAAYCLMVTAELEFEVKPGIVKQRARNMMRDNFNNKYKRASWILRHAFNTQVKPWLEG